MIGHKNKLYYKTINHKNRLYYKTINHKNKLYDMTIKPFPIKSPIKYFAD